MEGYIGCIIYKDDRKRIRHFLFATEGTFVRAIARITSLGYDFVALVGNDIDFVANRNFCTDLSNSQ